MKSGRENELILDRAHIYRESLLENERLMPVGRWVPALSLSLSNFSLYVPSSVLLFGMCAKCKQERYENSTNT